MGDREHLQIKKPFLPGLPGSLKNYFLAQELHDLNTAHWVLQAIRAESRAPGGAVQDLYVFVFWRETR